MKNKRLVAPVLWMLCVLIGFWLVFKYWRWILGNWPGMSGWALLILKVLYDRVDIVYLIVQHVWYWISNPDTQWDLLVKYKVTDASSESLSLIQRELCKAAHIDRAMVRIISKQRIEIRADELDIEVFIDDESSCIEVLFNKIPVSFRGAQRTIEKRISPILESIEKEFSRPESSYWLSVYFGNINPYFGLYMRRLRPENVKEMNVRIGSPEGETLVISKEKLMINATSLTELGDNARKYLTLSKLPA